MRNVVEKRGRMGKLLRCERLYSLHLVTWRRQREARELAGLTPRKRGRKAGKEASEISQLRRENGRLEQQLQQAELIVEVQKKLSEILAIQP